MTDEIRPATSHKRPTRFDLPQERIVFLIAVVLFVIFSVALPGFVSPGNLVALLQSVAVLGILAVAMAIVIVGRGIDLAIVAVMAISVAWVLDLANHGMPFPLAALYGLAFALAVGIIEGLFIAYVEIPPIFATLAISTMVFGFGRYAMVTLDVVYLPANLGWIRDLGAGTLFGVPSSVILLGIIALQAWLFLGYTRPGRFIRAMGDNPQAARIKGVPMRPMIVGQYALSSFIGFVAGLETAMVVASMNLRVISSTLVYDVVLVVVLGGVGLNGGKGGVRNVLVGTLLIGILFNGMTIMDVPYTVQNIVKGVILLIAITVDTFVNPRDEQTSQQGDI